jgi:hypothetical protein
MLPIILLRKRAIIFKTRLNLEGLDILFGTAIEIISLLTQNEITESLLTRPMPNP